MPLESFPLPEPAPDPQEAARLLALTQTALEGPLAALQDAAGGALAQTGGQLEAIRKRLLSSGQARLRATGRDLGMVLDRLHGGAQAALAETAASLSTVLHRAGRLTPPVVSADVYWTYVAPDSCQGTVVPAPIGVTPVSDPAWNVYGPYQTAAEASQAVTTFQQYLQLSGQCQHPDKPPPPLPTLPPVIPVPPASGVDWYWQEGP